MYFRGGTENDIKDQADIQPINSNEINDDTININNNNKMDVTQK